MFCFFIRQISSLTKYYEKKDHKVSISSTAQLIELGTLNQLFGINNLTQLKSLFLYEKYSAYKYVPVFDGRTSKIYAFCVMGNVPVGDADFDVVIGV